MLSPIPAPPIGRPAVTDVTLHHISPLHAHFPKVFVPGENDPLILGKRVMPSGATRDLPDSVRQILVVRRRRMRIKAGKFFELHGGAAENETSAGIALLLHRLAAPHMGDTIFIFENGHIREPDGVVFEM